MIQKAGIGPVLSILFLTATFAVPVACLADPLKPAYAGVFDSLTLHTARGIDHNLLQIPRAVTGGGVRWEDSWFEAVSLSRNLGPLGDRHSALAGTPVAGWQEGYEVVLARHRGLQRNGEIGVAYRLQTPTWTLGPVGANLAVGVGLSQALSTPSYEDGPEGDPSRRYRLQMLAILETEVRLQGLPEWSLTARVHHRSGVYGLVAPPRVGSNFLAAGIRRRF